MLVNGEVKGKLGRESWEIAWKQAQSQDDGLADPTRFAGKGERRDGKRPLFGLEECGNLGRQP